MEMLYGHKVYSNNENVVETMEMEWTGFSLEEGEEGGSNASLSPSSALWRSLSSTRDENKGMSPCHVV